MSLYIVESSNFENRRTKKLSLASFSNIKYLLSFVKSKRYQKVEILVDQINNSIVSSIYRFIEDKEMSIGILSNHPVDKTIVKKYNISVCKNNFVKKNIVLPKGIVFSRKHYPFKGLQARGNPKFMQGVSLCLVPDAFKINEDESFRQILFRYLRKSKKTNVEIYTKGGMTRKLFSKIVSTDNYLPKKATIFCLIIGMELDIDDALDLLNAAGYSLSNSIKLDKIVKAYVEIGDYDINKINEALESCNEPLLGWKPRED